MQGNWKQRDQMDALFFEIGLLQTWNIAQQQKIPL